MSSLNEGALAALRLKDRPNRLKHCGVSPLALLARQEGEALLGAGHVAIDARGVKAVLASRSDAPYEKILRGPTDSFQLVHEWTLVRFAHECPQLVQRRGAEDEFPQTLGHVSICFFFSHSDQT